MVTMTGSQKQVAWAETIRREALGSLAAEVARYAGEDDHADMLARLARVTAALDKKTDAAWWIDRRGTIATDYVDFVIGG